ncbi:MAG: hypothetical protein RMM53_12330, partial [Bacteroidia bacterium]|nr:hypothetical protein [Bacteroidia bacterium]
MFEWRDEGGRIVSLRYQGTELLFQPDGPANDDEFYGSGWDEMLGSVEACEMDLSGYGRICFPDHGEAWRERWHGRFEGKILPYVFERRLRCEGRDLLVEYSFLNAGRHPIPCFWAMHPVMVGRP